VKYPYRLHAYPYEFRERQLNGKRIAKFDSSANAILAGEVLLGLTEAP
jgi:hypothetical protein